MKNIKIKKLKLFLIYDLKDICSVSFFLLTEPSAKHGYYFLLVRQQRELLYLAAQGFRDLRPAHHCREPFLAGMLFALSHELSLVLKFSPFIHGESLQLEVLAFFDSFFAALALEVLAAVDASSEAA